MLCCEMVQRSVLKKWVEGHLATIAPGFMKQLNKLCVDSYRVDCVDLLLDDPQKLRDLLLKYNSPKVVEFIIGKLLLKPVLKKIGRENMERILVRAFMENPDNFKKLIRDVVMLKQ